MINGIARGYLSFSWLCSTSFMSAVESGDEWRIKNYSKNTIWEFSFFFVNSLHFDWLHNWLILSLIYVKLELWSLLVLFFQFFLGLSVFNSLFLRLIPYFLFLYHFRTFWCQTWANFSFKISWSFGFHFFVFQIYRTGPQNELEEGKLKIQLLLKEVLAIGT